MLNEIISKSAVNVLNSFQTELLAVRTNNLATFYLIRYFTSFHSQFTCILTYSQGRSQTFSFGGATRGASFATRGAVNGLCRTFRNRPTPVA